MELYSLDSLLGDSVLVTGNREKDYKFYWERKTFSLAGITLYLNSGSASQSQKGGNKEAALAGQIGSKQEHRPLSTPYVPWIPAGFQEKSAHTTLNRRYPSPTLEATRTGG